MADFVSRAGEKLDFALDKFAVDVNGKICADFGASTGGFTDCLLGRGAKKVYSVDTAYGEFAWKLRNDPRVVVMERTNAMHVSLPEKVDFICVDTGWTKQKAILPNVFANLKPKGIVVSLIKPHYEVGKARLGDDEVDEILKKVKSDVVQVGGRVEKLVESPLLGGKGKNREFLALIKPAS